MARNSRHEIGTRAGLFIACLLALSTVGCQTAPEEQQIHIDRLISMPLADQRPTAAPEIFPEVDILEPPDLWQAIRANFRLDHHLQQKRVQAEIRWLKRHPQYLINLRPRMEKYLAYISQEVAARGYPGEIALLPIVESALDPFAFSPGGAEDQHERSLRVGERSAEVLQLPRHQQSGRRRAGGRRGHVPGLVELQCR